MAASKIIDLTKPYEPNEERDLIVDFIKDLCDLRILENLKQTNVIKELENLTDSNVIDVCTAALEQIKKFSSNMEAVNWYTNRGIQTIFLRKQMSFTQLASDITSLIYKLRSSS